MKSTCLPLSDQLCACTRIADDHRSYRVCCFIMNRSGRELWEQGSTGTPGFSRAKLFGEKLKPLLPARVSIMVVVRVWAWTETDFSVISDGDSWNTGTTLMKMRCPSYTHKKCVYFFPSLCPAVTVCLWLSQTHWDAEVFCIPSGTCLLGKFQL